MAEDLQGTWIATQKMPTAGLLVQTPNLLKDSSPVPGVVPIMTQSPRALYQVVGCGGRPYGNCPQLVKEQRF
jgi:hypothetical protein